MVNEVVTADLQININNRPFDTIKVLKFIRDFAVKKKVRRVVIAGDIYEHRTPKPEEQKIFQQWVQSCVDNGLKVLIVLGNHDIVASKLKEGSTYYTIGEFENLGIDSVKIVNSGYKEAGIFYGHFLLRGSKVGPAGYMIDTGVTASELVVRNKDCNLFLLGDVHKHQVIDKKIVYIGSPERENFGEFGEAKGFVWVKGSEWKFVETPARNMVLIKEPFNSSETIGYMSDAISSGDIVKVIVNIDKKDLKHFDESLLYEAYKDAYSLLVEYRINQEKVQRIKEITESKSPKDCFLEYAKKMKLNKEQREKGIKILREVV